MNRKNNPWISMIALLVFTVIIVTICTGCKAETTKETEAVEETIPRFTFETVSQYCAIVTDNETGNQYLFVKHGYGGGLTKLDGE